jgi:methionine-rich copper-binding protein CopC
MGEILRFRLVPPTIEDTRRMKRLPIIAIVAALVTLWTAPNAWAHTELVSSDPDDGAEVIVALSSVTLTFNEPVDPDEATIDVIGPGNAEWEAGAITAVGTRLIMPVRPTGPPGRYTIAYRIVSADGDPVGGSVSFSLAVVDDATSPTVSSAATAVRAQPADAGDGGLPVWVWVVMGLVVAGVIAVGVAVKRSSRPS